jgi:hypothetical protein
LATARVPSCSPAPGSLAATNNERGEPLLIRATARAGQGRRAMSRVAHDVRYRLPRRAVAAFQAHKKRQAAERLAAGAAW